MSALEQLVHADGLVAQLAQTTGWRIYPRSVSWVTNKAFFLAKTDHGKRLGIVQESSQAPLDAEFDLNWEPITLNGLACYVGLGELSHANAQSLRHHLEYTRPRTIGLSMSAGLGDRLGIATPGHIRAMRHNPRMVPIYAQQSIREMERTERTPDNVIDDATWGVFQEGWTSGYGADADHLMTPHEIDICVAAGFTLYTFDPRYHVDNEAESDDLDTLRAKFAKLPWDKLATTPAQTAQTFIDRQFRLDGGLVLSMTEEGLLRAACKYGQALAHLSAMYQHLASCMGSQEFEVEISVDETDTPTKPIEHLYIVSELRRLGVTWVSLAPRYLGRFEKGVDYIGDLQAFEADFAQHVAIARTFGPYKLSLHSGSDKFSIYPIAWRLAGELVHLKTAGTSYLEALRAVARVDPGLFREIFTFAIAHYEADKATYHVSGQLDNIPAPDTIADAQLPAVLDQFDTRQAFHVTFGTVLTARDASGAYLFRDRLYAVLNGDEETHYAALEAHLAKHVLPFGGE